jgi:hypothetical protein
MKPWMLAALLTLSCNALAETETPVPKELDGWQAWVQYGQEFQHCPFLSSSNSAGKADRICAWPGRLTMDLNQVGGRFTQSWTSYVDTWLPLPGNLEYWPVGVTINGAAAAVVARDGIPHVRVGAGTFALAGGFSWATRPESLPIPQQTGLVTVSLEGHKLDQPDRPHDAVWLGKRHEAQPAQQLEVQVYRLLSDGIPVALQTRVNLQVAGDAREETLPPVLPPGFQPTSLDSELPARIDADGHVRMQVRAGSWTVTIQSLAPVETAKIINPAAQSPWPQQEVWSYAADDRLRVAALEGVEGIDAAQANVPQEWRAYPSYRVLPGSVVRLVERSRGLSVQDGNHLSLQRQFYLDFAHQGFTVTDQITGVMRSAWRLDMRAPYRLMRATTGVDNLLVTETDGSALTGVELRSPMLNLGTVARLAAPGGAIAATGWTERFDHVAGELNLPPGHRLLAAIGADSAPGAWVERWGLLDLFLLLIATVITLRLLGRIYAVVTFAAVILVHQDEQLLVWLILLVVLTIIAVGAVPVGWARTSLTWIRNLLFGALLLISCSFAVEQVRFALYPQLADSGGYPHVEIAQLDKSRTLAAAPAPESRVTDYAAPSLQMAAPPRLEEMVVTGAKKADVSMSGGSLASRQRYAPGTLVQAGPGVPHWRYVSYPFSWSGPVEAAQQLRFIIMPPWLVGVWRILSVALLAVLFVRLSQRSFNFTLRWRPLRAARGVTPTLIVVAVACTLLGPQSRASSTPDAQLLNELKSRLLRPPQCLPNCAEIMAGRLILAPTRLEASFDVAALSAVAVALPNVGQHVEPDAISVDGTTVPGVYRDGDGVIWIALKPGAHSIKVANRLPSADSLQVLFPQVPRSITVSGEGWDVTGVNAGRLLGNTIELTRRRVGGSAVDSQQGTAQFAPFVRIRREFTLDLDWSLQTTVQRLAPEKGGFTLEIPVITGESVLTNGIATHDGTKVLVGLDSNADEFTWQSGLAQTGKLALTAAQGSPWSEVWTFQVSPMWRVAFSGPPAVMPERLDATGWTFEYFPRPGETLTLDISRPPAAPGRTLAIDNVRLELDVGKRSTNTVLQLSYRSTQGSRHDILLPEAARISAVTVDGVEVSLRPDKGRLPLALLPGAHRLQVNWQSGDGASMGLRVPAVDLQVPSSNITTVLHVPSDRWVLYAGGGGVGPAILYWGELLFFIAVANGLGRAPRAPLRTGEWLLLGLGLSTFSWSVLLLFAGWMFALRWREGLQVDQLARRRFNLLQVGLIILSLATVLALVAAIPFGLLASPDMRIAGFGQYANALSWFHDQSAGVLPTPWVFTLSIWWYKTAMLLWALWLAFALVRWLPTAWRALGAGGFWRTPPPTTPSVSA